MDLIALNAQVTTIISNDDVVSNITPFSRTIERLVKVSIKAETRSPNRTLQTKIVKAIFKSVKVPQPGISSNHPVPPED